jgi:O-antigen/teichoic acid export membrane protein
MVSISTMRSPILSFERRRLFRWAKTLSTYALIQFIVQGCTVLGGIVIVRSLSQHDYALYTIGGGTLALLSGISDLGVGNALLARGGLIWQDRIRLGQLVHSALALRWQFLLPASLVAAGVFFSLANKAGGSVSYLSTIFFILLSTAVFQLNYSIWAIVPRLNVQISELQKLDLGVASFRLFLLILSIHFMDAPVALGINGAAFLLQAGFGRRLALRSMDRGLKRCFDDRKQIFRLVKNQIPNALFYSVYAQSTLFVISVFGHTKQIAEVGALTRLGMLWTAVASVISTVVLPQIARAKNRNEIAGKYLLVLLCFSIGASLSLMLAVCFPHQIVRLLGGRYSGLGDEVVWIVAASICQSFVGLVWSMNAARGWVVGSWWSIPVIILCQAALSAVLDLSTVRGAVLFGALPDLSGLLILVPLAWAGMKNTPTVS